MTEEQKKKIQDQIHSILSERRMFNIPENILAWREGDEITVEHREALLSLNAQAFNLKKEDKLEMMETFFKMPDSDIAEYIALTIATESGMDIETFKQTFPTIARDGKSLAMKGFLSWNK
jgi:penicillin V acylase-like amidase (Ntn superfamily)